MKFSCMGMPFMGLMAVAKANGIKSRFLAGETRKLDDKLHLSRHLQTCNLGEDLVNCDSTSRSCNNFEIEGCIVYCVDDGSCEGANIKNSSVFCQTGGSCRSATIADSNVECSDFWSCESARIMRSTVFCGSENSCGTTAFTACEISCASEFQSCAFAEFNDQCSCSDNADYWMDVVKCSVNAAPSEEFCSTESAGVTCAMLGNPVCSGMPGYPATSTATSEPDGTSSQETEPTVNSQTDTTQGTEPPSDPPHKTTTTELVAIIVPVVVAAIGLLVAVVNRKRILHVYNHHIVGGNTNSPTKV